MCKRITSLENTVENSKHRKQNRIKRENKMRHEETGTLEQARHQSSHKNPRDDDEQMR